MDASSYIRWFRDIRLADVPLVGGKTASLGELYSALTPALSPASNSYTGNATACATRGRVWL